MAQSPDDNERRVDDNHYGAGTPVSDCGPQPLAGVRVIEFCNVAAGPFCGSLLADMGAEVIKVESSTGDSLRSWPPLNEGFSENFASLNRNKQSIVLNLKDKADHDIARRLVDGADVVIENNRPGVMVRLGLGYEECARDHPELIYCSMSAFGQDGPRSQEGGFDVTIQAISGIMSVTGEPGGAPVKCGVPISDFAAGLYGSFAVTSLLARVRSGGAGGHIDVPMQGVSLAIAALQTSELFGTGADPKKLGSAHPRNAPYEAFEAEDGHFVLAAGNDKLWGLVTDIVGRPDLMTDDRFLTTTDRAAHQDELKTTLETVFRTKPAAHWLSVFATNGVPSGPINTYSQALDDDQVRERGWVQPLTLGNGQETRTFASPLAIDGERPPIRNGPPQLDADREEILAELDRRTHRPSSPDDEPT